MGGTKGYLASRYDKFRTMVCGWKANTSDNIACKKKNGIISKQSRFPLEHIIHTISSTYWISFCLRGCRREKHTGRLSAFNAYRPVSHSRNPCWVWISVRKARELNSFNLASLLKSTQNTAGDSTGSHPRLSPSPSLSYIHTLTRTHTLTSAV